MALLWSLLNGGMEMLSKFISASSSSSFSRFVKQEEGSASSA